MSKSEFTMLESFVAGRHAETKTALATFGVYFAGTCAYCLLHQAIVSSATPDVTGTVAYALRDWGVWGVLTPVVFKRLKDNEREQRANKAKSLAWFASLILCIALAVPLLIDQLTGDRDAAAGVTIYLPRYAATLVVVYLIWHVFFRRLPPASSPENTTPPPTAHQPPSTLLVSKGADKCLVPIEEVQYLSAAGNYVEIRARNQCYLLRTTMKQVAEILPTDRFVRIHRSHIVSLQEIERIKIHRSGSGTVHLRCGSSLGLSKGYRAALQRHRSRCS